MVKNVPDRPYLELTTPFPWSMLTDENGPKSPQTTLTRGRGLKTVFPAFCPIFFYHDWSKNYAIYIGSLERQSFKRSHGTPPFSYRVAGYLDDLDQVQFLSEVLVSN